MTVTYPAIGGTLSNEELEPYRRALPNRIRFPSGSATEPISFAVILIPWPIYLDASKDPFLGNAVGVLTVDIESAGTSDSRLRQRGRGE